MDELHHFAPLTDDDIADMFAGLKRNAVRQRAIAWAMLSPDGMRLSTFARGSNDPMLKAEESLLGRGFVIERRYARRPADDVLRLRTRWCEPYRSGIEVIAAVNSGTGLGQLALRWLSDPDHHSTAVSLLGLLGRFPSGIEVLAPLPNVHSTFGERMYQWTTDSCAHLTLAYGAE